MPANTVKTAEDEKLWARAKQRAEEQGQAGNYAYIQAIYQTMKKAETPQEMVQRLIQGLLSRRPDLKATFEKSTGPFIGPRGGMWADADHKKPWKPDKQKGTPKPQMDSAELIPEQELEGIIGKLMKLPRGSLNKLAQEVAFKGRSYQRKGETIPLSVQRWAAAIVSAKNRLDGKEAAPKPKTEASRKTATSRKPTPKIGSRKKSPVVGGVQLTLDLDASKKAPTKTEPKTQAQPPADAPIVTPQATVETEPKKKRPKGSYMEGDKNWTPQAYAPGGVYDVILKDPEKFLTTENKAGRPVYDPQLLDDVKAIQATYDEETNTWLLPETSAEMTELVDALRRVQSSRLTMNLQRNGHGLAADQWWRGGAPSSVKVSTKRNALRKKERAAAAKVQKDEPKPVVVKPAPGPQSTDPGDDKLVDVGEHVFGSRKDIRRLAMEIRDGKRELTPEIIEKLDYDDAAYLITKKNLVPVPTKEALEANGHSAGAAHLVLTIMSFVQNTPALTGKADIAAYGELVRGVYNGLMNAKTVKQVQELHQEFIDSYGRQLGGWEPAVVSESVSLYNEEMGMKLAQKYTDETGVKHRYRRGYGSRGFGTYIEKERAKTALVAGKRFKLFLETSPTGAMSFHSQSNVYRKALRFAEAAEAANASFDAVDTFQKKKKAKATTKRGWSGAKDVAGEVVRTGATKEVDGANPERTAKTFGFTNIQYGEWMSQADREYHTAALEGGMYDLMDVLGVEADQMSLNGRMAVAMGARGQGKASAHYEPSKKIINLTKMKGGGSLAHEWGHALDNVFAEVLTDYTPGPTTKPPFLTTSSGLTGNVRDAVQKVRDAMFTSDASTQERRRTQIGKMRAEAQREINVATRKYNEVAREWKALDKKPKDQDTIDRRVFNQESRIKAYTEERDELRNELKTNKRKSKDKLELEISHRDYWIQSAQKTIAKLKSEGVQNDADRSKMKELQVQMDNADYEIREAKKAMKYTKVLNSTDSDFLAEAKQLDGGSGKAYYATDVEMFARAFESYIQDELEDAGRQSTYLVDGTTAEYDTKIPALRGGVAQPYPQTDERKRINAAMKNLIEVLKAEGVMRKAFNLLLDLNKSEPFELILDELSKGAGHKYIRRIPTGNPKRPWKYVYSVGSKDAANEDAKVGEKVRITEGTQSGHYEVKEVHDNGWLTVKHDETGTEVAVRQDQFKQLFLAEHAEAASEHRDKLKATLDKAVQKGSAKQIERAQQRVDEFRERFPDPAAHAVALQGLEMAKAANKAKTAVAHSAASARISQAVQMGAPRAEKLRALAKEQADKAKLLTQPKRRRSERLGKFPSKEKGYRAILESLTGSDIPADFVAADQSYRAWKDGKGTKPQPWEGGELDAVNVALDLRGAKRVSSAREAWDKLTAGVRSWNDPQVLTALEILREVPGFARVELPENVREWMVTQAEREAQKEAEEAAREEDRIARAIDAAERKAIQDVDELNEELDDSFEFGANLEDDSFDFGANVEQPLAASLTTRLMLDLVKADKRCWDGYEPVPGKAPYSEDSCRKVTKAGEDSWVPPQAVQAAAKRSLEVRAKKPPSERGMTATGLARARDLANGRPQSLETLRTMRAWFERHEVDKQGETWDEQGKGWQAWMGWGGDPGRAWAKRVLRENDEPMEKSYPMAYPPTYWAHQRAKHGDGRVQGFVPSPQAMDAMRLATTPPPKLTMTRILAPTTVHHAADIARDLGLPYAAEQELAQWAKSTMASMPNVAVQRVVLHEKMKSMGMDPSLRQAVFRRAQVYWGNMFKSEQTPVQIINDGPEELSKGAVGGKYSKRVKLASGRYRYFYDEDEYERSKHAHPSGEKTLAKTVRGKVQKAIEEAGKAGIKPKALKSIARRHGKDIVASVLKDMHATGGLRVEAGKLFKAIRRKHVVRLPDETMRK